MLCYGIKFLNITTDPVELWAAPNSRSRVEKDYFDSHFQPFYRTEQIIITSNGLKPVSLHLILGIIILINIITQLLSVSQQQFTYNSSKGPVEFGPVFNKTFIIKVFELQESIKNISTLNNYTLADICFAPLSTSYTGRTTVKDCAIQSVWGYFQDNMNIFNNTDYGDIDHLKECLQ